MEQARRWAIKKQAAVCTTQMQVHCAWRVSGWQVDTALSIVSTRTKIWYSKPRYWLGACANNIRAPRHVSAAYRSTIAIDAAVLDQHQPGVFAHRRSLIIAAAGLRHRLTSIIELLACGPGHSFTPYMEPYPFLLLVPGIHRSYGHMGFRGTIGLSCWICSKFILGWPTSAVEKRRPEQNQRQLATTGYNTSSPD